MSTPSSTQLTPENTTEDSIVRTTDSLTSSPSVDLTQKKSVFQLLSLAVGFLGIQFAWSIQILYSGPILEKLGSAAWLTALIMCAGPVTGVVVQPIVGALSDRAWTVIGRRRPFILVGALLTALSLICLPNVSAISAFLTPVLAQYGLALTSLGLILAAALIWVLDASINTSQGPYRALVMDIVPKTQQPKAQSFLSLAIGLGSVAAFCIGFFIEKTPLFYMGAVAMIGALLWTSFSTQEQRYPLGSHYEEVQQQENKGFKAFMTQTWQAIITMPTEAKKLCLAHSFTWFGLVCLFNFFSLYVQHEATASSVLQAIPQLGFLATTSQDPTKLASLCFALFNASCFIFSGLLSQLTNHFSSKSLHTIGLLCLSTGLSGMFFTHDPLVIMGLMSLMGVGWATTLSLPFAILGRHVPSGNEGVLAGTFNIFIAAPQFIALPIIGALITTTGSYSFGMITGGLAILGSVFLLQWVKE